MTNLDDRKKAVKFLKIALVICIMLTVAYFIVVSKYVETDAFIVNITQDVTRKKQRNVYQELTYTYEGKQYQTKRQLPTKNKGKIGEYIKIKVNPNNPEKIADEDIIKILLFLDIVILLMLVLFKKRNLE